MLNKSTKKIIPSAIIQTERLILRQWSEKDLEPFAQLNADTRVREYFPGLLSRQESDASVKLMSDHIERCGWGFWATSLVQTGEFIGFIGLEDVHFTASFNKLAPAVEIGWRLAFNYWGKGYATEGALAALRYGYETLNLEEIVSFTAVANQRSRHVMEKIGMHHDPKDDFDHPKLLEGHPLRKHVLYRKSRITFRFTYAQSSQRALLHQWFEQKHIKEWMHGVGLQNTLNGLEKFFQGDSNTTYWIAYDKDTPFAFLITSPEGNDATTLDVFICDPNYLGKGIAMPMIREFLISQFPNVTRVLIDPEATNKRAIHVYQKVGFKIIGEFIASWHPVPHYQMELYMKDLLETKK